MLHILRHSPFTSCQINDCLLRYAAGDAIILIEDAVFASTMNHEELATLSEHQQLFIFQDDLDARGIQPIFGLSVDIFGWVALTVAHQTSLTW